MIEKQTKPTWTVGGLVNRKLCLHITASAATIFPANLMLHLPITGEQDPQVLGVLHMGQQFSQREQSNP